MSQANTAPRMEMRNKGLMIQSLVMTPQLQQAIKLLQMSNLELNSYLEMEMEKNPLLEKPDDEFEVRDAATQAAATADEKTEATDRATDQGDASYDEERWGDRVGAGDDPSWNLSATSRTGGGGGGFDGGLDALDQEDNRLHEDTSLREHVTRQMQIDITDPSERLIAFTLMDHLNEAGYLIADLAALAGQLGCTMEKMETVLAKLQKLEPTGIFARDLQECLGLQLKEKGRFDPAMERLLQHLDLLAAREKDKLMKLCGVDAEDFAEMVGEIRALNPKPALAFDHDVAPTVIPDILMRVNAAGGWVLELNQETLPRVLVNQSYLAKVQNKIVKRDERDYLSEKLQSANWLVKALHQRANTILKVASEIVRQQDMFFQHGVEFLKPMTLRDVATVIGMHESTVSRVTTNKYIITPRGMFELKYFFSVSISGCSGLSAHSAESVRHRIKTLVDSETRHQIMSDDALVKILKREGVEIARRTVAKYRESMHIPSSAQRRREKHIHM